MLNAANTVLFVIGMHRSGTSALTRVLNLGGVTLPANLMMGVQDNPLGHWEPIDFVAINDAILGKLDQSWATLWPVDLRLVSRHDRDELYSSAKNFLANCFAGTNVILLKDPRLCLLSPFWREACEDLGLRYSAVLTVRSPQEVSLSLAARNGIADEAAQLLWWHYSISAEIFTRGWRRRFVSYERLLRDPLGVLRRVAPLNRRIERRPSQIIVAEISKYLDPNLRHHRAKRVPTAFLAQIEATYRMLSRAAWAPAFYTETFVFQHEMDRLRNQYTRLARIVPKSALSSEVRIGDAGAT